MKIKYHRVENKLNTCGQKVSDTQPTRYASCVMTVYSLQFNFILT